jgi:hypothetical protein
MNVRPPKTQGAQYTHSNLLRLGGLLENPPALPSGAA